MVFCSAINLATSKFIRNQGVLREMHQRSIFDCWFRLKFGIAFPVLTIIIIIQSLFISVCPGIQYGSETNDTFQTNTLFCNHVKTCQKIKSKIKK